MSGLFNIDKGDGLGRFCSKFPLYLDGASGEVGIWADGRDITCSERPDSRKIIRHMGWR